MFSFLSTEECQMAKVKETTSVIILTKRYAQGFEVFHVQR